MCAAKPAAERTHRDNVHGDLAGDTRKAAKAATRTRELKLADDKASAWIRRLDSYHVCVAGDAALRLSALGLVTPCTAKGPIFSISTSPGPTQRRRAGWCAHPVVLCARSVAKGGARYNAVLPRSIKRFQFRHLWAVGHKTAGGTKPNGLKGGLWVYYTLKTSRG